MSELGHCRSNLTKACGLWGALSFLGLDGFPGEQGLMTQHLPFLTSFLPHVTGITLVHIFNYDST